MMLFVANIGSTMARMFAFVFGRITKLFLLLSNEFEEKRALALKNRQKLFEINNQHYQFSMENYR